MDMNYVYFNTPDSITDKLLKSSLSIKHQEMLQIGLTKNEATELSCYLITKTGNNIIKETHDMFKETYTCCIDKLQNINIPIRVLDLAIKYYMHKNYGITYLLNNLKLFDSLYYLNLNEDDFDFYKIKRLFGFTDSFNYTEFNHKLKIRLKLFLNEDFKLLNRIADKTLLNTDSHGIYYELFLIKKSLEGSGNITFNLILSFMKTFDKIKSFTNKSQNIKILQVYLKNINNLNDFITKNFNVDQIIRIIKYQVLISNYGNNKIFNKINVNDHISDNFNLILDNEYVPKIEKLLYLKN
jgi:hypothetical protein